MQTREVWFYTRNIRRSMNVARLVPVFCGSQKSTNRKTQLRAAVDIHLHWSFDSTRERRVRGGETDAKARGNYAASAIKRPTAERFCCSRSCPGAITVSIPFRYLTNSKTEDLPPVPEPSPRQALKKDSRTCWSLASQLAQAPPRRLPFPCARAHARNREVSQRYRQETPLPRIRRGCLEVKVAASIMGARVSRIIDFGPKLLSKFRDIAGEVANRPTYLNLIIMLHWHFF